MLDLLLKDFGPIWLLVLFPLMFLMIGRGARQIHRTADTPSELARFTGFPERLATHPRRCRMCSLVLFTGVCLVAVMLVGIPIWVVLHNEIASIDRMPSARATEKALLPLEISLMVAMVTGFSGVILIFSAYLVAFLTRTQPGATEDPEASLPLAETNPEGDDEHEKEAGQNI